MDIIFHIYILISWFVEFLGNRIINSKEKINPDVKNAVKIELLIKVKIEYVIMSFTKKMSLL